jgi:hypothetical protein
LFPDLCFDDLELPPHQCEREQSAWR